MKELLVTLPEKRRGIMDELLSGLEDQPEVKVTTNGEEITWKIFLKTSETNYILKELKGRGIGSVYGEIILRPIDLLLRPEEEGELKKSMGINLEEILFNLTEDGVLSITYILLAILSGLLAAFGLITESVVILIGSMIVSPLLNPIVLTSIGLLTPGAPHLRRGVNAEVIGILAVIFTGLFVGVIIRLANPLLNDPVLLSFLDPCNNPEMVIRTKLDYATLALAIFSGLAAGIIISKGESVSVVGVAIAASLAPPAANIGLILAAGKIVLSLMALGWLLANIFLINISISAVLWFVGVARGSGITGRKRGAVIRNNILWIVIFATFTLLLWYLMTLSSGVAHPCGI